MRLKMIKGLRLPITKSYASNVYWMYSVLVTEEFPLSRDELRAALKEKGVDTRDFFPSTAQQPIIKKLYPTKERFPVSERIAERGLYLPSGLALTQEQLDYVCDCLRTIAS